MKAKPVLVGMLVLLAALSSSSSAQLPEFDDSAVVKLFSYSNIRTMDIEIDGFSQVFAVPVVGHGSGVLVDPRGVILTAKHVVEGARFVSAYVQGKRFFYPVFSIYEDDSLDFAFVYISGEFRHYVQLPTASPELQRGGRIWAYGYPMIAGEPEPSINSGHITLYSQKFQKWQLDAAINPGNSGGPIVDDSGRISGIVVSGLMDAVGMYYALPMNDIVRCYEELESRGDIKAAIEHVRGQNYSRRRLRNQLASYIAEITINDRLTLEADESFEDLAENLVAIAASDEFDTWENEDADIAAIASAFLFNRVAFWLAGHKLGANNPSHYTSPAFNDNHIDELVSNLGAAIKLANASERIDPSITSSDYILWMREWKRVLIDGADDKGSQDSKEKGQVITKGGGGTGDEKWDDPPTYDINPYALTVDRTWFRPAEDVRFTAPTGYESSFSVRDFGWLSGWTLCVTGPSEGNTVSLYNRLSIAVLESSSADVTQSVTTTESLSGSVSLFQISLNGLGEIKISGTDIVALFGLGTDIGGYTFSEYDDPNFFSNLNGFIGLRVRVFRVLASEATYKFRFVGDGTGQELGIGVGLLYRI